MADLDVTQDANLTSNTAPNLSDRLLWVRNSDSSLMDITFDQLLKLINSLTEDTAPAFDSDYITTYDASASAPKKVLLKTANRVVQVVNTQSGAVATGTTLIPFDDTIPQNTEGNEFMTLAITPTNANNILYIDVAIHLAHSVLGHLAAALFQDTTANALAVGWTVAHAGYAHLLVFRHKMTAGTTSATTFKVRGGADAAGTTTFNGSGTRVYGGVLASSITITEVKV